MEPNPASEELIHNRNFYLDYDPMAVFLVENQLFRVHRHFLIEGSEVFRDMFAHAGDTGKDLAEGATEGTTDDCPIPLPDVTVQEFEALLRCFYVNNPTRPTLRIKPYAQNGKLALLSIAHRFNFSDIFEKTIKDVNVNNMTVLDKIRLGDKYDMNEWLLSAYTDILDRTPELTWNKGEAEVLGLKRVNKLLRAKKFMLHERLGSLETSADSYSNLTSSRGRYKGSGHHHYYEMNNKRATTSTEKIVKKYFSNEFIEP